MTASWIDVLLDPASVAQGRLPGATDQMTAIAYLLEGRPDAYGSLSTAAGLPSLDQLVRGPGVGSEALFVGAVVGILQGRLDGVDTLIELAEDGNVDSGLRTAAAVLAGVALSGASRADLAIEKLSALLRTTESTVERGLLHVHLALRLADIGDYAAAASSSHRAVEILAEPASSTEETVAAIAHENEAAFLWATEQKIPQGGRASWSQAPIAWINAQMKDAVDAYISQSFDSFFSSPYQRTISFGVTDKVEEGLSQALLGAQCLGSWNRIRHIRKLAGRYELLNAAGRSDANATVPLLLLVRAGDYEGVAKAAGLFRAIGPLEPLRNAGSATIAAPWAGAEARASLAMIYETSSTLSKEAADAGIARLLDHLPSMLKLLPFSGWVIDEALKALASLTDVTEGAAVAAASRALFELASAPPQPRVHQPLASALNVLNWDALSGRERARWLSYATSHISARDDHVFVAAQILHQLAATNPKAFHLALATYRETRSPLLLSLLVGRAIPSSDRSDIQEAIVSIANRLRTEAHEGRFSMSTPSAGELLGRAVHGPGGRRLIGQLIDFATDSTIPVGERTQAIATLLWKPGLVPKKLGERLANGIPASQDVWALWGLGTDEIDAVNMALKVIFGPLSGDELMLVASSLSHSPSAAVRADLARKAALIVLATRNAELHAVIAGLTWDGDANVRAAAGHWLSGILVRLPEQQQIARWLPRLQELLGEPGELVPLAVWTGLTMAGGPPQNLPPTLTERARLASKGHLSVKVRRAALAYLGKG
jgi:hypothetical protein